MVNDGVSPASCVVWLLDKLRHGKFRGDGFFPLDEEYNHFCVLVFKVCEEELGWLKENQRNL